MAKKPFDDDEMEFEEDFLDEANEHNIESAMVARDYSDRRILVLELDESHLPKSLLVLRDLLTGATIEGTSSMEAALRLMEEQEWDTFVVDFLEPGISSSEFVKQIHNQPEAILVAVAFNGLTQGAEEERNRFKLEPLRKLFDVEKPGTSKPTAPV